MTTDQEVTQQQQSYAVFILTEVKLTWLNQSESLPDMLEEARAWTEGKPGKGITIVVPVLAVFGHIEDRADD